MIAIIIIVVLLIIAGLVYVGLRQDQGRDPLQERLAMYGERETPESLEEVELSLPFRERVIIPMLKWLADLTSRFTPQQQLESAGHQGELGVLRQVPTWIFAPLIL
ncbi:MAG: hypothetical protein CUN56_16765, partial [Phototrophicales bacterium]